MFFSFYTIKKNLIYVLAIYLYFPTIFAVTTWDGSYYEHNSDPQFQDAKSFLETITFRLDEQGLDVGCGTGRITEYLAKERVPQGTMRGLDACESMISFAQSKSMPTNVSFVVKRAQDIHCERKFDFVVCFAVLNWIAEQELVLTNIERILKPGGRLILQMVDDEDGSIGRAAVRTIMRPKWRNKIDLQKATIKFYPLTEQEIRSLLEKVGFHIESCEVIKRARRFDSKQAFCEWISGWLGNMLPNILGDSQEYNQFIDDVIDQFILDTQMTNNSAIYYDVSKLNVIAVKK